MRISELLWYGTKKLKHLPSATLDAELLLAHVIGTDRAGLYAHLEDMLPSRLVRSYHRLIGLRRKGIPVAYLIGRAETMIGPILVDPRVLIPRSSTELLVQAVTQHIRSTPSIVADIGTGSGFIAIALAKALPAHTIEATDISPSALQLAQINARAHGVDQRIRWRFGSLMQPWHQEIEPQIIVANLPYVPNTLVAKPELRFEPKLALFGGDDGLGLIRQLLHQLNYHPMVEVVAIECQPDQVDTVAYLLRNAKPKPFQVNAIRDGSVSWGLIGSR